MTDAEREAFLRGYAYGCDATIRAHDGLMPVLALASLVERHYIGPSLGDWHDATVRATWAKVRRVRFDEQSALDFHYIVEGAS